MNPRGLARPQRLWGSVGLLMLAVVMVFGQWPERGLWYDETVNAYFAERSWADVWEWCTKIDNQMPLHFVLLKLWGGIAGTSEFSLRFFSVACGLLALAGVMSLGQRLGASPWAGWLAGAAMLVSQSFLYAAYEVRPYTLLLALLAWSGAVLWVFWQYYVVQARSVDWRYGMWLAAYWVLALALVYTHYTALVALAAHGAYVSMWTAWRRSRLGLVRMLHLAGGLVAGYVPWMLALAGRDVRAGTAYDDQITPDQALHVYGQFWAHGQRFVPDGALPYEGVMGVVLVASVALWCVRRWRLGSGSASGLGMALAMIVVPLSGLLVMVFAVQGKLSGRHGWMLWVGAAVVVGLGLAALARFRVVRWVVWLGALGMIWLPATASFQPIYNSYLREAFAYINERAEPGDVLVLRDGTLFSAAGYYDAALPWIGLPADKLTDVTRPLFFGEALAGLTELIDRHQARRVWVLAWQGEVMDPQNLATGLLEMVGQAEPLTDTFGFGDVSVARYRLTGTAAQVRQRVDALTGDAPIVPEGPVYLGGYVIGERSVKRAGVVTLHTWWMRGEAVVGDLRISARLYDSGEQFYALMDGPPVPEALSETNWRPGEPILGRVALVIPSDLPTGQFEVRLVVYDMDGSFEPFSVPVDRITVHE